MWCRKCNKFYDTESDTCEKCGQKLEDYTSIVENDGDDVLFLSNEPQGESEQSETAAKDSENSLYAEMLFDGEPKLLITVIGEDEAARIMELLEQNNVPSMKKEAQAHTADEECDNDFEGEELELIDGREESEDYEAEFSALCDEALEGEELYDIFVPAECFSNALRIVIEDEQAEGTEQAASEEFFEEFGDVEELEALEEASDQEHGEETEQPEPADEKDTECCEEAKSEEVGEKSEPCGEDRNEKGKGGKKKNGLFGFLHRKEK